MSFGALAFLQPALLLGLLALPGLWWLLRIRPPPPKRAVFPPFAILMKKLRKEETPATSPWWLLLLRLVAAAAVILAFAGPTLDVARIAPGAGPLTIVVDDGWSAAPDWRARREALLRAIDEAEADGRPVRLLGAAPPHRPGALDADRDAEDRAMPAAEARALAASWEPRPWPADRGALARRLALTPTEEGEGALWIADGVAITDVASNGEDAAAYGAAALADALRARGELAAISAPRGEGNADGVDVHAIEAARATPAGLEVDLVRAFAEGDESVTLVAREPGGAVAARADVRFAAGDDAARAAIAMPAGLRDRIELLTLERAGSAGAAFLIDENARRRTVGLASVAGDADQPLLAPYFFVERALAPFAEISRSALRDLLAARPAMTVLADSGRLSETERAAITDYVEAGGVFLRFAGPNLAAVPDPFAPAELRDGSRELGGALSWAEPLAIAHFAEDGPFAGLTPPEDVRVRRQVLARPTQDLAERALATLEDGTPLITGARVGEGWFVFVHVTANAGWSDLPLSGVFPEMLRRLTRLASGGSGGELDGALALRAALDGFGQLAPPPRALGEIDAAALRASAPGPDAPPGLWGAPGAGSDGPRLAHGGGLENGARLAVVDFADLDVAPAPLDAGDATPIAPWLFALALLLLALDGVASAWLRQVRPRPPRWTASAPSVREGVAAGAVLALSFAAGGADAQEAPLQPFTPSPFGLGDSLFWAPAFTPPDGPAATRFAYVVTGDPETDRVAEAGLAGITEVLGRRTAIEAGLPEGVDPAVDPLAFYPILYWPITPDAPIVDADTADRIERYMATGGLLIIDSRDDGLGFSGALQQSDNAARLGVIFEEVDLPPLRRVGPDHALTRAFYLLQEFPGRFAGGSLWVGEVDPELNDGVSSLIVGGGDWIGAWAIDQNDAPLLPVTPGGERQREMARRFGVNLAMYAMTGNYKTDQVHVPALLERLGQ